MKASRLALLTAFALSLSACASNNKKGAFDYTRYNTAAPRSVLVVPVINHTNEAQAADLFLTTLSVPLAERGYYVFPTNMAKKLIENDGLSDPGLVHSTDTTKIAALFGADSVLYVEILDWKSNWVVTASKIKVKFLYTLKDGKSGNLIWQREQEGEYKYSISTGNFLADMIVNAVKAAADGGRADYTPVAAEANLMALTPAGIGVPFGPYSPKKNSNEKLFPSTGSGRISNAETVAVSHAIAKSD